MFSNSSSFVIIFNINTNIVNDILKMGAKCFCYIYIYFICEWVDKILKLKKKKKITITLFTPSVYLIILKTRIDVINLLFKNNLRYFTEFKFKLFK